MSRKKVLPVTPDEMGARKAEALPHQVIEVFNALIAEHWDGRSASFTQKEAAQRVASAMGFTDHNGVGTGEVYRLKLLDVEPVYREAGWKVEYDKPGYNETYDATFTFKKPRA